MKKFFVIMLVLSLAGCTTSPTPRKLFMEPRFGMTKRELIEVSGKPDSIEIYQKSDKTRVEFYTYLRIYQSSQSKVPVCLINNKVVGWGNSYYEDHVSADDIRIK